MKTYNARYKKAHGAEGKRYMRLYRMRQYRIAMMEEKREYMRLAKMRPCMDCGQEFPVCVMEFDHARGTKKCKVCEAVSGSWEAFFEELDKCDVVCANCHNIRTFERLNK